MIKSRSQLCHLEIFLRQVNKTMIDHILRVRDDWFVRFLIQEIVDFCPQNHGSNTDAQNDRGAA